MPTYVTRSKAKLQDLTNKVDEQNPIAHLENHPTTSQVNVNAESEGLSLLAKQTANPRFLEPTAANQSPMPAEVPRTIKSGTFKTASTYNSRSSTGSSRLSAQTRSAILKARIQSEAKIDEIQKRQYAERHAFERLTKTQRL